MIRYTNLEEHRSGQNFDIKLFGTNFNRIWAQEKRLLLHADTESNAHTDTKFSVDFNEFYREGSSLSRHGQWAHISIHIKAKKSRDITSTASTDIRVGQISDKKYWPVDTAPLVTYSGRWARAHILATGEIRLSATSFDIAAHDEFKLAGFYRISNVPDTDPNPYLNTEHRMWYREYGQNMLDLDERISRASGGHTRFNNGPQGTAGLLNELSANITPIPTEPDTVLIFGNVVHVQLNSTLKNSLKTNSLGETGLQLYRTTPFFEPKHTVGIACGSSGTVGYSPMGSARVTNGGIYLANLIDTNRTYDKGTAIRLAGTFLLKDK